MNIITIIITIIITHYQHIVFEVARRGCCPCLHYCGYDGKVATLGSGNSNESVMATIVCLMRTGSQNDEEHRHPSQRLQWQRSFVCHHFPDFGPG